MDQQKFKSVLLLDDDEVNNFVNEQIFKRLEISENLFIYTKGQDALQFLQHYADENNSLPELIFIDINMPVMDGFEFTKNLQKSGLLKKYKTTLITLTTSTATHDIQKFKKLGVDFYLNKPLTKKAVTELSEKLLRKPIFNTFATPIIPANEKERLSAVKKYKILDTEPEQSFNFIVEEAATYFNVPIALVSIVDADRVFFKANKGMPGVTYADRGMSLCSLAILKDELTVFTNATEDPCLLANPLVHGPFGLKFYAGAPITDSERFHIGTVCIVDKNTREFTEADRNKLKAFAAQAMELINKRIQVQTETK